MADAPPPWSPPGPVPADDAGGAPGDRSAPGGSAGSAMPPVPGSAAPDPYPPARYPADHQVVPYPPDPYPPALRPQPAAPYPQPSVPQTQPAASYPQPPAPYPQPAAPHPGGGPRPGVAPYAGIAPYPTATAPAGAYPAAYPTAAYPGAYPTGAYPVAYPGSAYPGAPVPAPYPPAVAPPAAAPTQHPAASGPRRWWQQPVRRWLLEAWVQVVCLMSMTAALSAASDASGAPDGTIPPAYMLAWLVAVPAGATVSLRRSRPVLAVLVTGLSAVLLPIDALAVLVALPWAIARCRPRVAWACGALAALAVTVSQWRDAGRRPDHALFSTLDKATGEPLNMAAQGFVIVGVVLLAVSVGWGLVRRSREAVAAAARSERAQAQQVQELRAELTTELTRQDERDLIARELHDTVAHHLSVVSLRASALEVSAGDDGVQDAARSMRSSAHQALEEMRDLIAVLRDAQVPLTPGPMPGRTLADLPELVATARDGGADIAATVFVTDGAAAPATLTRAVYRIVQEALTNALKHAPHARVDLDVRAAPGDGVHLRIRNLLAVGSAGVPGSGTGIVGMRERAASVGGTVEAGPDGGTWQVVAHLPWPAQGGPTIEG